MDQTTMKSTQKYIRTSPRKLRLVADAVRGLPADRALEYLKFLGKRAALPVSKAITAAVASAKDQDGTPASELTVKILDIAEGPTFKRWRAVSRGAAHSIKKRSSHVIVELERKHGTKS
jgi:large subunit ribosomal protein L22